MPTPTTPVRFAVSGCDKKFVTPTGWGGRKYEKNMKKANASKIIMKVNIITFNCGLVNNYFSLSYFVLFLEMDVILRS